MEPKVILEDSEFIAVNKPAGVLVHKTIAGGRLGAKNEGLILADWVKERYPEIGSVGESPVDRPGIVHRLDRETSGVVVVARTQAFFEDLKKQFQEHTIKKVYIALVRGHVAKDRGKIDMPIGLKPGTTKRSVTARTMKMVKEAITNYEVIERFDLSFDPVGDQKEATLLKIEPETGRTHQIRVHLAAMGNPVVGDALYGPKADIYGLGRHFLHASSLEFSASGRRVKVEADLPPELSALLDALRSRRYS